MDNLIGTFGTVSILCWNGRQVSGWRGPGPGWLVCSEACLNQLAAWIDRLILTSIHWNPWQVFLFFFFKLDSFFGKRETERGNVEVAKSYHFNAVAPLQLYEFRKWSDDVLFGTLPTCLKHVAKPVSVTQHALVFLLTHSTLKFPIVRDCFHNSLYWLSAALTGLKSQNVRVPPETINALPVTHGFCLWDSR